MLPPHLTHVFPDTASANAAGHLTIGGCDAVELVEQYGTPLYVLDEATLRSRCRQFADSFAHRYSNSQAVYASKAYINPALARIFADEGLGLDVVSGGELAVAQAGDVPLDKVYFHGNNKTPAELAEAVAAGIGRVVVDSFHELDLLEQICADSGKTQDILVRVSPGIDPHTHAYTTTGIIDRIVGLIITATIETLGRRRSTRCIRMRGTITISRIWPSRVSSRTSCRRRGRGAMIRTRGSTSRTPSI